MAQLTYRQLEKDHHVNRILECKQLLFRNCTEINNYMDQWDKYCDTVQGRKRHTNLDDIVTSPPQLSCKTIKCNATNRNQKHQWIYLPNAFPKTTITLNDISQILHNLDILSHYDEYPFAAMFMVSCIGTTDWLIAIILPSQCNSNDKFVCTHYDLYISSPIHDIHSLQQRIRINIDQTYSNIPIRSTPSPQLDLNIYDASKMSTINGNTLQKAFRSMMCPSFVQDHIMIAFCNAQLAANRVEFFNCPIHERHPESVLHQLCRSKMDMMDHHETYVVIYDAFCWHLSVIFVGQISTRMHGKTPKRHALVHMQSPYTTLYCQIGQVLDMLLGHFTYDHQNPSCPIYPLIQQSLSRAQLHASNMQSSYHSEPKRNDLSSSFQLQTFELTKSEKEKLWSNAQAWIALMASKIKISNVTKAFLVYRQNAYDYLIQVPDYVEVADWINILIHSGFKINSKKFNFYRFDPSIGHLQCTELDREVIRKTKYTMPLELILSWLHHQHKEYLMIKTSTFKWTAMIIMFMIHHHVQVYTNLTMMGMRFSPNPLDLQTYQYIQPLKNTFVQNASGHTSNMHRYVYHWVPSQFQQSSSTMCLGYMIQEIATIKNHFYQTTKVRYFCGFDLVGKPKWSDHFKSDLPLVLNTMFIAIVTNIEYTSKKELDTPSTPIHAMCDRFETTLHASHPVQHTEAYHHPNYNLAHYPSVHRQNRIDNHGPLETQDANWYQIHDPQPNALPML